MSSNNVKTEDVHTQILYLSCSVLHIQQAAFVLIVLRPFSKRGLEIGVTPPHGRTKHNHIFLIA